MVVDDHQIVRLGLVALISGKAGLHVVAETRNGQEAIALFHEHAERVFNPLLTVRELDVMRLASRGARNKEIGSALAMALGTVKTHMINIFEKLGVNDRRSATAKAVKRGLVRSPF